MMASSPDNHVAGASSSHINGRDNEGHVRRPSLGFSDTEEDEHEDEYQGDYSSRMEELFEDGEENGEEEDDDDEGFLYTGMDADESLGDYRSQLRDVLGHGHDDEEEEAEVERSLLHDADNEKVNPDDSEVGAFFICISYIQNKHRFSFLMYCRKARIPIIPYLC